jgi:hypothetical protein
MPSSQNPPPPERAGSENPRADIPPPPSLRLQVPADGPVAAFARLVDALDIKDYRTAAAIRSELYRKLGWAIVPPPTPPWGGRRS